VCEIEVEGRVERQRLVNLRHLLVIS